MLFRLQKYKKFESNSQHGACTTISKSSCFDCKSTKNLRAIHNVLVWWSFLTLVVSTAKVQKIWEQFTTSTSLTRPSNQLFRLQKYKKFESNSQRDSSRCRHLHSCFDCKSTKNLRAIHNANGYTSCIDIVVSTAKVQKIWEQFTTRSVNNHLEVELFRLQKYKKFESNSQLVDEKFR